MALKTLSRWIAAPVIAAAGLIISACGGGSGAQQPPQEATGEQPSWGNGDSVGVIHIANGEVVDPAEPRQFGSDVVGAATDKGADLRSGKSYVLALNDRDFKLLMSSDDFFGTLESIVQADPTGGGLIGAPHSTVFVVVDGAIKTDILADDGCLSIRVRSSEEPVPNGVIILLMGEEGAVPPRCGTYEAFVGTSVTALETRYRLAAENSQAPVPPQAIKDATNRALGIPQGQAQGELLANTRNAIASRGLEGLSLGGGPGGGIGF